MKTILLLFLAANLIIGVVIIIEVRNATMLLKTHMLHTFNSFHSSIDRYEDIIKRQKLNRIYLQFCLICIRPYMIAIMTKAIQNENYEEAEECKKIISQIEELIEFNEEKQNTENK